MGLKHEAVTLPLGLCPLGKDSNSEPGKRTASSIFSQVSEIFLSLIQIIQEQAISINQPATIDLPRRTTTMIIMSTCVYAVPLFCKVLNN